MAWYYTANGTEYGPCSEIDVRLQLRSGIISAADKVRPPGSSTWISADQAREYFAQAPALEPGQSAKQRNKSNLARLRADSCYPTFRAFISIAAILGYSVAAILGIVGLLSGAAESSVRAVLVGLQIAVLTKIASDLILILADIADAAIDSKAERS